MCTFPHGKKEETACRVCNGIYFCYAFNKTSMAHVLTSYGEIADKYTILEIKLQHITDETKRLHIRKDMDALMPTIHALTADEAIIPLIHELKSVNQVLWCIEDFIRLKEQLSQFDEEFITLARNVYKQNDERARIKHNINVLTRSPLIEEKSYQ